MLVPGAYFRNETIWRGRMVEARGELKATIYELGGWAGAMYMAAFTPWEEVAPLAVGGAFFARMLFAYLDEMQGRKRIEQDISRYFDETYPER